MIFIDTGAFVARYLGGDQFHKHAIEFWTQLENTGESCSTSNFVLDETLTLLARRSTYRFAAERGTSLFTSRILQILRPDADDEMNALDVFTRYSEHRLSFTDCISFALMRKHKIRVTFSFDQHFRHLGFKVLPQ
ncbi:MAG: PIN domain-containing protein [Deltaproteobacteria bacterium]|nr:PIN domain-containing protein [Deltaproteobacteria bacterium]